MSVGSGRGGYAKGMEGGIAILLLLVIVVGGGILGIALYLTGGALWFKKTDPEGDKVEGRGAEHRPTHKRVTSPEIEHTTLAGTREDPRHREH